MHGAADFPRTFEKPILTKSGEERLIAWQNSRIVERGAMTASISFGIDGTERRKADQAIRDLNAHLEERVRDRTAKLEQPLKDMGAFSHSISHDLRAPFRAINGYAWILATDEQNRLSKDGRQMLERIANKANHIGKLIDDVLEYLPIERRIRSAGQSVPSPSTLALCSTRLSTDPSEVACLNSRSPATKRRAAASAARKRKDSMAP